MKCVTITDAELAELRARLSAAEQELSASQTMLQVSLEEGVRLVRAAEARAEAAEQALRRIAFSSIGEPRMGRHASVARAALAGRELPTETDEEDNEAAMQAIRDGLAGREETGGG